MSKILVIEDEAPLRRALRIFLEAHDYAVVLAASGREGLDLAAREHPDVVILDLGLPDMDGVAVARALRGWSAVPIVVLSARDAEPVKVAALDAGADDYVTKPFRLGELLARIRARVRTQAPAVLRAQDVEVDAASRRAWRAGEELELTAKEFDVLAILVRRAGTVVTREDLMTSVWDEHWFGSTRTLDVHMSWLRKKLDDDVGATRYITTVRGVGFRFEKD
jgi:DNA-binding response OmpR family regulator